MKNETKKPIGLTIKELADRKNLSAAVLAGKIGVARGTIYELYKKHDITQIKKIDVIEDVLGLAKGSLFQYYYDDLPISELFSPSSSSKNKIGAAAKLISEVTETSDDNPFKEIAMNWKLMYERAVVEQEYLKSQLIFKDELLNDFRSGAIKKFNGGLHPVLEKVSHRY
jgi:transcriptional regulator with XRE-family HTH domain